MTKPSPYKTRKIKKLQQDIKVIENEHFSFLDSFEGDQDAEIYALQLKKSLLIRSLVIEFHLSIEDAMDSGIKNAFYRVNTKSKAKRPGRKARAYFRRLFPEARNMIEGGGSIGFKRKTVLLRMLRVIDKELYDDLDRLNALRNRSGHNWVIDKAVRRKGRQAPKKYVLTFEGQNLFNAQAMVAFLKKYNDVYLAVADRAHA